MPICLSIAGENTDTILKGNVAVYKDLNLEFVTKNSFCHKFAARKSN